MKKEEIKKTLEDYSLFPRKKMGQNFLVDEEMAKKIVESGEVSKIDTVIEVGPGTGALTRELAERAGKVIAVEKDKGLVNLLRDFFEKCENVEIVEEDILNYEIKEKKYKVIANVPYYITSPIIRKFLEERHPPSLIVLTLQKEVAERIKARPPKMNLLAVSVQVYAEAKTLFHLPPSSFYPSPGVTSSVVSIKPVLGKEEKEEDFRRDFFRVVRAGFSSPRKQLKNNLSLLDSGNKKEIESKTRVEKMMEELQIDPLRRAETLTIEEWKKLTRRIKK